MPRDPVQPYSAAERLIADLERNKAIRELREEIIADRLHPRRLNCLQAALLCSLPTVALLWWVLR